MDAEWRPTLTKFTEGRTSILQIADHEKAFIVDLVALANNKVLDKVLTQVFTSTTLIGFQFKSDVTLIKKSCPDWECLTKIERYLDIGLLYQKLNPPVELEGKQTKQLQITLKKVVPAVLGEMMCKNEQLSNWEIRPLRLSQ